MKIIYIIILFLSLVSCKKNVLATMKIHFQLKDTIKGKDTDNEYLKIYKDGKVFKEYSMLKPPYPQDEIELEKLTAGKYKLEYYNYFEQKITKTISIDESKVYKVILNPDISNTKTKQSEILNLREKEILKIKFEYAGCFSGEADSIKIQKLNGNFFLSRANQKKLVNDKELEYLITLESNLRELNKKGGCSSIETMIFIRNNTSDTIWNRICRFKGYKKLEAFIKRNGIY
ncbi:hypothetical protein [Flavobacterium sp. XGLA_31]|uniref:hypothetical protein n=1 Tax=Flavobacterium sp. XGLA_31 TaxID=3447666 RepID=UPI003F3791DA